MKEVPIMMYEEKMKLRTEVTFIDDIVYGVEPCHYYDDGVGRLQSLLVLSPLMIRVKRSLSLLMLEISSSLGEA